MIDIVRDSVTTDFVFSWSNSMGKITHTMRGLAANSASLFKKNEEAWNTYLSVTGDEFFRTSRAMQLERANEIITEDGYTAYQVFQENFDELLAFNLQGADESAANAEFAFYMGKQYSDLSADELVL